MEKIIFLLLFLFCNIMWLYAQNDKIAQMETSLEKIRKNLQQKKLEYSWTLMNEFLDYCGTTTKLLSPKSEPRLPYIIYELKPKELKAPKEAYESARDELKKMLSNYPEHTRLDLTPYIGQQPMRIYGRRLVHP